MTTPLDVTKTTEVTTFYSFRLLSECLSSLMTIKSQAKLHKRNVKLVSTDANTE